MKRIKTLSLFAALSLLVFNACTDDSNPTSSNNENQETAQDDTTDDVNDDVAIIDPQALQAQMETLSTIFSPETFKDTTAGALETSDITTQAIQSQLVAQDIVMPDSLIQTLVDDPDFLVLVLDAATNGEPNETAVQSYVMGNLDTFLEILQYLPEPIDPTNPGTDSTGVEAIPMGIPEKI